MEKPKRERATNFNSEEVRTLINIVLKYSHVIENKETDAVTWKQKNEIWETVAAEFNALSGCTYRTGKVLRLEYDIMKRNLKKKTTKNKQELFKTGGDTVKVEPLTDYEEKLLQVLTLSVEGLPSHNDSDGILAAGT
ncbi:hypothetical protein NQ314_008587 [Rhamnusium bicolor]|uniref:Regulatory protein zeste n=1 Tax=Rhamnusium bicolor TaxID=1586634 RepID=A0AAV8Y8M8_9CUCU|nr:hypothetical protein NQ314_008587 [Rhamnusium bicolor]